MTIRTRFQLVGIFILAQGLLAATLAFVRAAPDDESNLVIGYESMGGQSFPITTKNSKRYQAASEQFFGKAGGQIAELREWLGSLWHGRRLAYTLAVLSIASCATCFYLADFLSYPLPQQNPDSNS